MIKKLRRKFIVIAMLSLFCVLAIIMTAINVINYTKITTYADDVLAVLYSNDGRFPMPDNQTQPTPEEPVQGEQPNAPQEPFKPSHGMNEETPYETRYFTVRYEADEVKTDVRNIAAVSSEEAISLADNVIEKGKSKGYMGVYRYLKADDDSIVIFVDCARQKQTANNFLKASLLISGIGIAAVFILVFIISKFAVKPIAESYEKQKRFITDASHELKTPLTIISANNELIELTAGETQASQAISKQVVRMTAMVKNLTALARLDESDKLVQRSDFSLSDTLIDMTALFRPSIESGNRTLNEDIAKGLTVNGDETLIRQALSIILENAVKYAKTYVNLKAYLAGKNVTIEFSNDADNVTEGNLDRCFERFYRTDEARASTVAGNGIGLSIAKSIVELHGGTITATGLPNNVFEIKLNLKAVK